MNDTNHGLASVPVALAVGAACFAFVSGCGEGYGGPQRYTVSGSVTYQGQAVPKGFVRFAPDTSKGNSGPGGGAPIEDGYFETPREKGIVGGPYVVTITGTDGVPTTEFGEELPDGKQLFPAHRTRHEFPREDTEWDFDVPAE